MADTPPELTLLGIKIAHLIAGAVGGLVRSMTRPGGSITRHVTTAVVGTAVAGYGTPIGAHMAARYLATADISTASLEGMVGFVLGLTGMSVCEAVIRRARQWRDGPPTDLHPPSAK